MNFEQIAILFSFQEMPKIRHNDDTISVCLSDTFTSETTEQI